MSGGDAGALRADIPASCSTDASKLLKRKRGDWVVSMGVACELDIADLPFVEDEDDLEVVCLSQVLRKLRDPAVGSRDCVIADPTGGGSRLWSGTRLSDFMKDVGHDMKAVKMLADDAVSVVVYEAYKLWEEDFTVIMQSTLRMKKNARFVKRFRNFVSEAAEFQGRKFSPLTLWINESIPFGIFVQAILLLWDAKYSTDSAKNKADSLLREGLGFFQEIMQEGIKKLQEDYEVIDSPNAKVMETLEFMKDPTNTEVAVREIVACASLRKARNETSHPFSSIASSAVRESALVLYSTLLTHEFTKDIRHIAVLGKVRLDLLESSERAKLKQLDSTVVRDSWLLSDSEDEDSDDDLAPKLFGRWDS